jgi:hypothetical protein
MCKRKVCGFIAIHGVIIMMLTLSGCSTTIDKDTKLLLKGPKAELKRTF